jgi:hypothetical protein
MLITRPFHWRRFFFLQSADGQTAACADLPAASDVRRHTTSTSTSRHRDLRKFPSTHARREITLIPKRVNSIRPPSLAARAASPPGSDVRRHAASGPPRTFGATPHPLRHLRDLRRHAASGPPRTSGVTPHPTSRLGDLRRLRQMAKSRELKIRLCGTV